MTRQPSSTAFTEQLLYGIPSQRVAMNTPKQLSEAFSKSFRDSTLEAPVYMNYRLHDGNPTDKPFQAFQGSLPILATQFMSASYVEIQLESEKPLPFDAVRRFRNAFEFGHTLEGKVETH